MIEKQSHEHKHWHYIYKKRKRLNGVSTKQIIIGQLIAMIGSLAAGYLLELNSKLLLSFAGAYLLLPGMIDLAASITGVVCAKINHQLEEGKTQFQALYSSNAFGILSSVTAGLIVGLVGGLVGSIFFGSSFVHIVVLAMIVMPIVALISFPIVSCLTIALRSLGLNPDNIIGPVETGLTDLLTVFTMAVIVRLLV